MKSRTVAGALVAIIAAAASVLPATPAFASGTGEIIVQVVTPAGTPIAMSGLQILIRDKTGSSSYNTGTATQSDGTAPIGSLPASKSITVVFNAQSNFQASSVSGIHLASGQTETVKIVAALGATVAGTLAEGSTSAGLAGADVGLLNSKGELYYYGTTDGSGHYSISGVASGSYRVQFNTRVQNPFTAAAADYAWSYWRGAGKTSTPSWSSAKTITVKKQSSHAAATAVTGLNGQVSAGSKLNGLVSYWPSDVADHEGQHVYVVAQHAADDFETRLNAEDAFSTPVNPGKYKIEIRGDYNSILAVFPYYWYVSDSKGPAASASKASWVSVGTTSKTILFVQNPTHAQ